MIHLPGRRFAWIELPRLPAERHAQAKDLDPRAPLALWEEVGATRKVVACSAAAEGKGVAAGMTLAVARGRVPGLLDAEADSRADEAALVALAEALSAFTPSLAPRPPSGLLLEIGRCARLSGGEEPLLRRALDTVRRLGFTARVAAADGEMAARVLARGAGEGWAVAPKGGTAAAVAALPVAALPLAEADRATLDHLGVRTVSAFAALPAAAVATRLGPEAAAAWRAVNGREVPGPMPVFHPPPHLVEAVELEGPASSGEGLLFRVRALLDRLEERLRGRGEGAASLVVWFSLEGGENASLAVPLARPMRQATSLLRVVRERLANYTVDAPIVGLGVEVTATAPLRGAQAGLFTSAAEEQALLDVLARLEGAYGVGAVFVAVERERHRPEAAWRTEPFDAKVGGTRGAGQGAREEALNTKHDTRSTGHETRGARDETRDTEHDTRSTGHETRDTGRGARERGAGDGFLPAARRPMGLLARAEPVDLSGEGGPAVEGTVLLRGRRVGIAGVRGPERLKGEWWTKDPFDREYFELALGGGARAWVFREAATGGWFLHGWFD